MSVGSVPGSGDPHLEKASSLALGASRGDSTLVEEILSSDLSEIDLQDESGNTPLHLAAQKGHLVCVRLLSEHGARSLYNHAGFHPIHWSVIYDQRTCVEYFLEKGQNLGALEDKKRRTIIHIAAETGKINLLEMFLRLGLGNSGMDRGGSPLHSAIRGGQLECAKKILDVSPQIRHRVDSLGRYPIHVAAEVGDKRLLELVFDPKMNIEEKDRTPFEYTPLLLAAKEGKVESLSYLLKKGANREATDSLGRNVMHLAILGGHLDCAKFLQTKGFSIEVKSANGDRPMHLAVMANQVDCALWLQSLNAKMKPNNLGQTPIAIAETKGYSDCLDLLQTKSS